MCKNFKRLTVHEKLKAAVCHLHASSVRRETVCHASLPKLPLREEINHALCKQTALHSYTSHFFVELTSKSETHAQKANFKHLLKMINVYID